MQQLRLSASLPIVSSDRTMELPFRKFMAELDRQLPIVGSGSPEGVVTAAYLSLYIDETADAGLITYRKMHAHIGGDRSMGWELVSLGPAEWGGIGGVLSDQTDLQNALDAAGGAAEWGGITGTLADQTDVQAALNAAAATATWGGIGGTLSDQADLQAALNAAGGYPPQVVTL